MTLINLDIICDLVFWICDFECNRSGVAKGWQVYSSSEAKAESRSSRLRYHYARTIKALTTPEHLRNYIRMVNSFSWCSGDFVESTPYNITSLTLKLQFIELNFNLSFFSFNLQLIVHKKQGFLIGFLDNQ